MIEITWFDPGSAVGEILPAYPSFNVRCELPEADLGGSSSKQPYWVTAERWTDARLDVGATQLAARASSSPSHYSKDDRCHLREIIFNISMSCLPEASLNYYWPDLHREVAKRVPVGERVPSEPELTKFGRDLFEITDRSALQGLRDQGIHHCFLALILEQAGIGKDRNRIIHEFLSWLVAARVSLKSSENPDWPTDAVRTFIGSQSEGYRHEIALLGRVLARIGAELVSLVNAIEARADRVDIVGWSWNQLRDWWLTASGSNLDALTPSAATILLGWISKLSSTWKRSDIFRQCRVGRTECHWPDGSSASSFGSFLELPLGVARVRIGDVVQDAVIVDELGVAEILELEQDVWHPLGDSFRCRTSEHAFVEHHPDFGSIRSVPVFAHTWDRTPAAHYWGRRSPEFRPIDKSILRVPVRFKWSRQELVAIPGNIRTAVEDGVGYSLKIGGKGVWSGEVRNGHLCGWSSRPISLDRLLATDETELNVSLMRDGIVAAHGTVPIWPLRDGAFLVSGNNVCNEAEPIVRWLESGAGDWRTSVIVRTPAVGIGLTDVHETSRRNISVLGMPYEAIGLAPTLGARGIVQVAGHKWFVEYRARLRLSYLPDREVVRGDISYAGSGNVRVVDRIGDALLRCDNPSSDPEVGLWLAADHMECFCRLESPPDNSAVISVGQLAESNGLFVPYGEIKVTIGTSAGARGVSFSFFIPPNQPAVETTRLGMPSRIAWAGSTDSPCWTESDVPISMADVSESKFCVSTLRGEKWEVSARWKPNIADIIVGLALGATCQHRYRVFALQLPNELPCQPVLTRSGAAQILFCGAEVVVQDREDYDLLPLIRSKMASEKLAVATLTAICGDTPIEWAIDASPFVRDLVAEIASDVNGLLQVEIAFQLASLFSTELRLSIDGGNQAFQTRPFWSDPGVAFEERLRFSMPARKDDEAERDLTISITSGHQLIHRSSLHVSRSKSSSSVTESIGQLVTAYRKTGSPAYLNEILLAFVCNFEEARGGHVLANIANRVGTGANPESETVLRLSLRMIEAVASGSSAYHAFPSSLEVEPALSAVASSIWLFLSRRFAASGLLNPADFSRAATLAQPTILLADKRVREVGALACGYARYVEKVEGLSTGISWATTEAVADIGSDLRKSIGRLSPDLGIWLGI